MICGEGVSGVAEVVEAEVVRHPDEGPGLAPVPPERGPPKRLALLSDEQQSLRSLLRVPVKVPLEVGPQEFRQDDDPLPRLALRRPLGARMRFFGRYGVR